MNTQTVLGLFHKEAADYFDQCRATARRLCLHNESGTTNSDEIQQYHPRPQYVGRNAMSSMFKHRDFVRVGTMPSKRASAKGHYIGVYKLAQPPVFRRWRSPVERDAE